MKKTIIFCTAAFFMLMSITGCIPLVIGGAVGVVGGYAASKDTIQGDTDRPYDSLWYAADGLSRARGIVRQEDSVRGYIEVYEGKNRVWISLARLTTSSTRVKVSSRNKYHLPNLNLAQDYFVRILEQAGK